MSASEIIFYLLLALANSFVIIGWNRASNFELSHGGFAHIETMRIEKMTCWERGIFKDAKDKMIFWKLRFWSLKYVGEFWSKPLLTCCTCMASFHGLYFYWLIIPFTPQFDFLYSLAVFPFYVLLLAGMATLVNNYA